MRKYKSTRCQCYNQMINVWQNRWLTPLNTVWSIWDFCNSVYGTTSLSCILELIWTHMKRVLSVLTVPYKLRKLLANTLSVCVQSGFCGWNQHLSKFIRFQPRPMPLDLPMSTVQRASHWLTAAEYRNLKNDSSLMHLSFFDSFSHHLYWCNNLTKSIDEFCELDNISKKKFNRKEKRAVTW